jgi:hypothetical protein
MSIKRYAKRHIVVGNKDEELIVNQLYKIAKKLASIDSCTKKQIATIHYYDELKSVYYKYGIAKTKRYSIALTKQLLASKIKNPFKRLIYLIVFWFKNELK